MLDIEIRDLQVWLVGPAPTATFPAVRARPRTANHATPRRERQCTLAAAAALIPPCSLMGRARAAGKASSSPSSSCSTSASSLCITRCLPVSGASWASAIRLLWYTIGRNPLKCSSLAPNGRSTHPIGRRTHWAFQFFYGLSAFNNSSDAMPTYIKEFFFYIGIASLSSDFSQAGCPDAPPGDFANKYYAQVLGLPLPPRGSRQCSQRLASVRCVRLTDIGALCADSDSHGCRRAHSHHHATLDPAAALVLASQSHR